MPYYEVIYENGSHSIMYCEDDAEASGGVDEQHRRATEGASGGPAGLPAERVNRVLVYNVHPQDLHESGLLPVEDVKKQLLAEIDANSMGGQVSVNALAVRVRDMTSPVVESGPHESNYAMPEERELEGTWL